MDSAPSSGPSGQRHDRDHPLLSASSADDANRKRGYSLRRSLFAHNMRSQSHTASKSIEMQRPGTGSSQTLKGDASASAEKRSTIITISEPVADKVEGHPRHGVLREERPSKSGFRLESVKGWSTRLSDKTFKTKPLPASADGRHVQVHCQRNVEAIDERTGKPHIDNTIISCRYTPWNFVPRQLAAQFGKLANFYFLCISILQMIPGLSTTGTYTTIVPLLIFVGLSMGKEGYDDIRRHRLDKEDNESEVQVLERRDPADACASADDVGGPYSETALRCWRTVKWQEVRVGQVLLLQRDEPVPADVVLLHAIEATGSAFIETKSLDGETNLKPKKPLLNISSRCQDLDSVADLAADFVVEDPNLDLYKFDGRVAIGGSILPLTNNEVLYRGSVLRNTPSALGIVIYSGEECKIRMNANKTPRVKAPALQTRVNRVVIFVAALVFFIAFLLTGLYEVWRQHTESKSWYLTSARVPFGHVFTSFVIMFNTMLPLSLYVSLEIVKVAQMFMMNDIDMYDAASDTPMQPHTSTINEELGQVSYIFSDKTGTLTNNSMKFRKISIAGTAWLHDTDLHEEAQKHARPIPGKGKEKATRLSGNELSPPRTSTSGVGTNGPQWKPAPRGADSLYCGRTEQLMAYLQHKPRSLYARKAKFFILALALCHTCVPEKDDEGNASFQAASPDELALVTAAHDLGYTVTNRDSKSVTVKTYPHGRDQDPIHDVYEVLDVIEFSSARKRMSIVVRFPDRSICLLTKGADTTISKLLRLAALAATSVSTVLRISSQRKSLEAQKIIRRRSSHLQAGPRESNSIFSMVEDTTGLGRASSISMGGTRSARDSVDGWLKDRENEVDLSISRHSNVYYTPRQSTRTSTPRPSGFHDARQSFASSTQELEIEQTIDESVAVSEVAIFEHCFQHIDDFATEGLRTLLYGYRFISEQEYQEWQGIYADASTSLENRQEKIEAAGELIEKDLELFGATAIEDKLQQGVPDAIDRFRRAGIKIWMLTGDKRETAINIGYSCRLIKDYSTVIILDQEAGNLQNQLIEAMNTINDPSVAHSVLLIDGQILTTLTTSSALQIQFTILATTTSSVICTRASPAQKASLVRTIRLTLPSSVTLAIGDGANDIAMIQEAHVGIGIAGREGLQAARTSDYSIAQFRFLVKLLLVHGRWNYVRVCKYTLGTFWKEMLFYLVQALWQRWNGWSGTSLYEPWSLSMFNTLFTSLPVIFIGIFEKDLAASTLLAVPELYSVGRLSRGFNFRLYLYWAGMGAVEAVVVFFTMYGIYGQAIYEQDNRVFAMGCLCFSACVTVISVKLQGIELHNKTITAGIAGGLSVGGWWVWNLALSGFYDRYDPIYDVRGGITGRFGRSVSWWATLIVVVLGVVLFEVVVKAVRMRGWPSDTEVFQGLERDEGGKRRFEESAAGLMQEGSRGGEKKESVEVEREVNEQEEREKQVQELLERPRTLDGASDEPVMGIRRRHSSKDNGGTRDGLHSKNEVEGVKRTSIDVSELFAKGFGKVKQGQELS